MQTFILRSAPHAARAGLACPGVPENRDDRLCSGTHRLCSGEVNTCVFDLRLRSLSSLQGRDGGPERAVKTFRQEPPEVGACHSTGERRVD